MIFREKKIDFANKLTNYLKEKDYTNRDFARLAKVNETQVSKWKKGDGISETSLENIAKNIDGFADYLLDGIHSDKQPENTFFPYNAKPIVTGGGTLTLVPLKAQGGFLNGYANRVFKDSLESFPFPLVKGEGWGFEMEGFSMYKKGDEDSLKPGDYVIGTEIPDVTWLTKGKTYIFITIDGICVKIFDRVEDGRYHLVSLNEEYNPLSPIPVKEVKQIFFKEGKYSKG